MKSTIASFAVVLSFFAAGSAAAQGQSDFAYQKALLSRPLAPADKAFCDGKAGEAKSAASDACRVTRAFLVDIAAGADKGFPPITDITYARNDAEIGKIMDKM